MALTENEPTLEDLIPKQYQLMVLSDARKMLSDQDDAQDVFIEVLIAVWEDRKNNSNCKKNFKAWLKEVTRNKCVDTLRKRRQELSLDAPLDGSTTPLAETVPSGKPSLEERMLEKYKDGQLWTTIGELPVNYRSVVILRVCEDLKDKEIALLLDISTGLVATRYHRAINRLTEAMGSDSDTN